MSCPISLPMHLFWYVHEVAKSLIYRALSVTLLTICSVAAHAKLLRSPFRPMALPPTTRRTAGCGAIVPTRVLGDDGTRLARCGLLALSRCFAPNSHNATSPQRPMKKNPIPYEPRRNCWSFFSNYQDDTKHLKLFPCVNEVIKICGGAIILHSDLSIDKRSL